MDFRSVFVFLLASLLMGQSTALVRGEGEVFLNDQAVVGVSRTLIGADSLVSTGRGRAEVNLRDGSRIFLGPNSSLRIVYDKRYNLAILSGSATVASDGTAIKVTCENVVSLSGPGIFRFNVNTDSNPTSTYCNLRVVEGAASVHLQALGAALSAGQAMKLNRHCGDMIPTETFDASVVDDFDRWVRALTAPVQPRN